MHIQVIDVAQTTEVSKLGKPYQQVALVYKTGDKVEQKKFTQFVPSFKEITSLEKGKSYNVRLEKNEKGYWDWLEIVEAKPGEKQEQDVDIQRLIVRQSSISNAIEMLKTDEVALTVEQVLQVASKFENYVFGEGEPEELL